MTTKTENLNLKPLTAIMRVAALGATLGLSTLSANAANSSVTWEDIVNDQATPEDVLGYGIV